MKVHFKTNIIDDLIGSRQILQVPEKTTLLSLFDRLVESYGEEVRDRLFTMGKLKSHLTVLVNGKPVSDSDLGKELQEPCEILLIQMLSGG